MPESRPAFGEVYLNRKMAALAGLGFASGLPYVMATDTLAAWLSAVKIDVTAIGLFALIGLPYTFKFLWAPLLDRYALPLLGRRRGWLIVFQILLAATMALMAIYGPESESSNLASLAALGATLVLLSASQDIVVDAYRADVLRREELGAGAAVFVAGYRVAAILAGAGMLIVAGRFGWRVAVTGGGVLMGMTALVTFAAPEPPRVAPPQTLNDAFIEPVGQFIRQWGPRVIVLIAFVLLFRLPDHLANRMTMPLLLQHLAFTSEEVGWIRQALGFVVTIIGALLGGAIIARAGLMRSLIAFGILQAVSNGGFLLLASRPPSIALMAAVIGVENLCNGMVAAGFVAFLMSCCDRRYSATQYALFTSLMAAAAAIAGAMTGYLVAEVGYVAFFAISIAAGVPGMLLLPWIKAVRPLETDHRCAGCGYDLTGNTSAVCSECGSPVIAPAATSTASG